jgi:acetyltransferase-like isoleucine patch superfamily enzyme
VFISDNDHSYSDLDLPIIQQPIKFKKNVSIGSGSWIGENVCIIGASIGRNCVIGANSVVTKDVPDFSVVAGNPAKVIKTIER